MLLSACSSTSPLPATKPPEPVAAPGSQPVVQPSDNQSIQQNTSADNATSASSTAGSVQPTDLHSTRLEIVYSHMNQRCPTCLCFEERINTVMDTYFTDQIRSGKLVYRVVNAQDPQNSSFIKKYKAVGSQLFINTVINGFDNIEDIQGIWDWNCRNDRSGFDLKVKQAIEQRLKSLN